MILLGAGYQALPYRIRKYTLFDSPFDEMKFDRGLWQSKAVWKYDQMTEKQPLRGMMYCDLVDHYVHNGMTKSEVEQLLGKPDNKDDAWGAHKDVWNYSLGAWSGFRVDGDYLTVEFDKQGKVVAFGGWQS